MNVQAAMGLRLAHPPATPTANCPLQLPSLLPRAHWKSGRPMTALRTRS